ncbi:MAG: SUMF1/EgtB/PvdO family nonheme iron enzyme [Deltaproteobacteria bacterium]|nr:SUMF1/EgtB/PvdO family nonheme iron enzyme [Deltaproteobacteria bacterium]
MPTLRTLALPAVLISTSACYQHVRRDAPSEPGPLPRGELVSVSSAELIRGDMNGEPHEYPEKRIRIKAFRIEKTEVTNAAYNACVEARACDPAPFADTEDFGGADRPVVGVTWIDAKKFCEWIGRRLPTEAEWELAAKGTDNRKWPWKGPFEAKRANVRGEMDGFRHTAPVGSFSAGTSPYGALDMSGNVAEWVADYFDPMYYRTGKETSDPTGPSEGRDRVVRGGSYSDTSYECRVSFRGGRSPTEVDSTVGFRCASE